MNKHCCLTCDVEIKQENDFDNFNRILDVLDKYNAICTFFILLIDEKLAKKAIKLIKVKKLEHELGLHLHWGNHNKSYENGLHVFSEKELEKELKENLVKMRKLRIKPVSFRSGGLCMTTECLKLVTKKGFKIDSSTAPKLNEKGGWHQQHFHVPYMCWYYPSKMAYDKPAKNEEDRLGILEVPVTRFIPSGRAWDPYVLEPGSTLQKLIIKEWLFFRKKQNPFSLASIFHSWNSPEKIDKMAVYMAKKNFSFITLKELNKLIKASLQQPQ